MLLYYIFFYEEFIKFMHSGFEMNMMRELNYFLKLQIKQLKDNIFINQAKYIKDFLKRLKMEDVKTMGTPMSSSITFDKCKQGQLTPFCIEA